MAAPSAPGGSILANGTPNLQQPCQDPRDVAAVIQAAMVPALQGQAQLTEHGDHAAAPLPIGPPKKLFDVNPTPETLGHVHARGGALLRHHLAEVPVAASHKTATLPAPLGQRRVQPGLRLEERCRPLGGSVHAALLYAGELRAEMRELRMVPRPHVRAELVHSLAGAPVHEHHGKLDDLLRLRLAHMVARRLEVQHDQRLEHGNRSCG
mmetsp:Transcript_3841/g.12024  ORF Transcript_3841/g.12024 Transcript_3841/m.12024 type:complete len:209 (-) Transcript_3841:219-845(-)